MQYSADSSPPQTTSSRSRSSETSSCLLEWLSPPKLSRTEGSGQLPGTEQSEPPHLLSRIDCKNSPDTENILSPCLQSHIPTSMAESYHLTKPSGSESGQSGILNCQITTNSPTLKLRMSIQSECQPWPAYTILLGWAGLAT